MEGTNTNYQYRLKFFLNEFTKENARIYHRQLQFNIQQKRYYLIVELGDLKSADELLYEKLISTPLEMLGVIDEAVQQYLIEKREEFPELNL